MAPAKAIKRPIADDVPIANRISTLHQVKKGTTMLPPPIPTMLDTAPIRLPATVIATRCFD
jgi:hypothetical protein